MSDWIKAAWMQTYTGRKFHPTDAKPDDIDPEDVAHALGMTCRYGGHTREFYSVAEHCVLMADWMMYRGALDHQVKWALLHDATEAYVGDMVRPLKVQLPEYGVIEDRLMEVIAERFELEGDMPAPVKEVDNRILLDEKDVLLTPPPEAWDVEHLSPLGVQIQCWDPPTAKREYLRRLDLLG